MKAAIIEYKFYTTGAPRKQCVRIENFIYDDVCTEVIVSNHPVEIVEKITLKPYQ
jgi:hypothetical protein